MKENKDIFIPNGKYNFPLGTEFYTKMDFRKEDSELVKCKTNGRIYINEEDGGIYECSTESPIINTDCNWNIYYENRTCVSDRSLFEAQQRGDMIC